MVTNTLARLCHAAVTGGSLRSTEVAFDPPCGDAVAPTPGADTVTSFRIDTDTAASVTLIVQAVLPLLVLQSGQDRVSVVDITGGTHVAFSPPLDFLRHVLMPHLSSMNVQARITSFTKGFYPVGRGGIQLVVQPQIAPIQPIRLVKQGVVTTVKCVVWGTGLGDDNDSTIRYLMEQLRSQILETLAPFISADTPLSIWEDYKVVDCGGELAGEKRVRSEIGTPSAAPARQHQGTARRDMKKDRSGRKKSKYSMLGCQLWCETDTGCILCANDSMETGGSNKSKMATSIDPAELARRATSRVLHQLASGAAVDEHTADQLLVFMAAAAVHAELQRRGGSEVIADTLGYSAMLVEPYHDTYSSRHIETAIYVIEKMFNAQKNQSGMSCKYSLTDVDRGCRLIECYPVPYA